MCVWSWFCFAVLRVSKFCNHIDGEERAGCFTLIVFLLCCVCLYSVVNPHGDVGLSAVCDCGIS